MVEKINNNSVRLVFPIKTEGLTISHVPTIQFLMNIYMVQRSWVDGGRRSGEAVSNNISCTVSVKPDEWDMVSDFICEHKDIIGGLSLFSFFADSEIPNCPRQAVVRQEDRERFKRMVDNYQPVDYTLMNEDEDTTSLDVACDSEKCAVNQPVDLEVAGGLRVFMGKPDCQEFYKDGLKFLVIYEYDGYFIAKRI
jgi:ribonucleoside-diphosphate reductase alpha chain